MVLYHALALFPMTYPSVDSHHSSDSRSRFLLWAGSYLKLRRLLSSVPVLCGHSILSLEGNDLVLPNGRIMFANKLQKSGKCPSLQKVQRANCTRTGTVTVEISLGS
jgi:hypothetical protein